MNTAALRDVSVPRPDGVSALVPRRSAPIIQVSRVGKRYANGTVALAKADLDICSGDFVTLIGPSGCGKSTLLRILSGLGGVTEGQVKWWGEATPVLERADQKLAFVFQDPTLMPWARVAENVALPLELKGTLDRQAIKAKVDEVLELVGLGAFHQSYPRELSGGMQMRVSIARALITEPDLMLMDEPFGALDEMTRNKLNDDVLRIQHERKLTVVFVTHSLHEAVYLSSRVVVMAARPGRVIAEVDIDAPFPRGPAFRLSSDYLQYMTRLTTALDAASRGEEIAP
ncbi:ABC transporter ATP-binding protein [Hydrogenophaga sp. 2FB]|uniref:ABC transporter ATP-binding protein n=1 Tax=Hydrogenophaga sp. 2FB TaxID=2502187 RepID=UPI00207BA941|nr:ABC transporter ATP-binding protein [Hydrogenophaga sp. 2FB]